MTKMALRFAGRLISQTCVTSGMRQGGSIVRIGVADRAASQLMCGALRSFSQRSGQGEASSKLLQALQSEMSLEKREYTEPKVIAEFLADNKWKLKETKGDVNMVLTREVNGKKVTVDFQLVAPFDGDAEGSNEEPQQGEMTDFSVTSEGAEGSGVTFYCTTLQKDDKFRYMIGNVRYFANEKEKELVSSYSGPEFEDLDESVQELLDDWLRELGVDDNLCNFIDAMSMDKEQKEYLNWLESMCKFLA